MDALTYKLEQFEGPLDLLLTLIQKNKVSITDIPISLICDQYLEYIREAEALDMDIASEFIVMASDLMLYKFHSENTRLQLNNLYEELKRAEQRIDAQIKVVVGASQEVSGLDKLEEKQLEEYRYLEAKEMQEEILEMVAKKSTEEEINS